MNIDGATLIDIRVMPRRSFSALIGNMKGFRESGMAPTFRLMERWVQMEFRSKETGKAFWIALVWAKMDFFPEGGLCIFLGNESDISWDWRPVEGGQLYVECQQELGFQSCFEYALSVFAE